MSLVKQITIAILATALLVVVGIGSYMLSAQVIPDSTSQVTPTTTVAAGQLTVKKLQTLSPKNIIAKDLGKEIQFQFDTEEKVGSVLYLTPDKTEKIDQVIKNYGIGTAIKGKFYSMTPEDSPSTAHLIKIQNADGAIKSEKYFFYIILMYQKSRIPYGSVQDYVTAPTQPYVLQLTN